MSDDGADMGITAERALETVLGGEPSPEKASGMTPTQMRAYLESAPDNPESYDDGARLAGKIILQHLDDFPGNRMLPAESEYFYPEGSLADVKTMVRLRQLRRRGLDDEMEAMDPARRDALRAIDLTGFMYGWAVNAAKYTLGEQPVANPAIVTVGDKQNAP